ncbi:hypothetical protein IQE94_11665 [Synechocystis sp. PCC 7339]|uniref:hypothetical protein n=1 Tax=Synechocystis sp. PCC 7339 TaxID=2782213 RepID=UPI001CBC7D1F|nr:hypothetical protein [Synechocystis sp. PCC 7339]UAJ71790.1 hypothetical protein IQE94_11665 [Synechocystis sp. PCC 7339]
MYKPKGGRGCRAPYETILMRVPLPLKPQIEKIIKDYRKSLFDNENQLNLDL